jgi:hypothetical protein
MDGMFKHSKFNRPIGDWDVGNVRSMNDMFRHSVFNKDINNWNVVNLWSSPHTIFAKSKYNHSLYKWNIINPKLCLKNYYPELICRNIDRWIEYD